MLKVSEVAKMLKVHPQTVYRWIYLKKLEALKIDGMVRVTEEQLNKFMGVE